jgi:hypothetical protein
MSSANYLIGEALAAIEIFVTLTPVWHRQPHQAGG